jgi:hypothetical protein
MCPKLFSTLTTTDVIVNICCNQGFQAVAASGATPRDQRQGVMHVPIPRPRRLRATSPDAAAPHRADVLRLDGQD